MTTSHGEAGTPAHTNTTASDREGVYSTTIEYSGSVSTLHVFTNEHLSQGGFGAVYKGEMVGGRGDRSLVAIKVVNGLDDLQQKMLNREVGRWRRLNHPNVQPYYGISGSLGVRQVGIVSPLAANGDMAHFILENPAIDRLPMLVQVAEALRYLHLDAGIVHGDLKCRNILITAEGTPMISDFGLSTVIEKGNTITATMIRRLSTVAFAAPELLHDKAYQNPFLSAIALPFVRPKLRSKTTYSDVFAFGRMVYEAYAGGPPWHGTDPTEIRTMVLKGMHPPRTVSNPHAVPLNDALWKFCNACWDPKPTKRPDCRRILDTLQAVSELAPTSGVQPMLGRFSQLLSLEIGWLRCWPAGSPNEPP